MPQNRSGNQVVEPFSGAKPPEPPSEPQRSRREPQRDPRPEPQPMERFTWRPKAIYRLLKDTYTEWNRDKAPRMGAALAYYTIFSIAPLLVIAIAIAGFEIGRAHV